MSTGDQGIWEISSFWSKAENAFILTATTRLLYSVWWWSNGSVITVTPPQRLCNSAHTAFKAETHMFSLFWSDQVQQGVVFGSKLKKLRGSTVSRLEICRDFRAITWKCAPQESEIKKKQKHICPKCTSMFINWSSPSESKCAILGRLSSFAALTLYVSTVPPLLFRLIHNWTNYILEPVCHIILTQQCFIRTRKKSLLATC